MAPLGSEDAAISGMSLQMFVSSWISRNSSTYVCAQEPLYVNIYIIYLQKSIQVQETGFATKHTNSII